MDSVSFSEEVPPTDLAQPTRRALDISMWIREMSSKFLESIGCEEERAGQEALLTGHVQALMGIHEAFECERRDLGSRLHPAEHVLRAVECSLMLRAGGRGLKETCEAAFKLLLPKLPLPSTLIRRLPSPSTVQYHILSLDLAYIFLEAELDNAEQGNMLPARYGMSDSSPLWGLDWLWTENMVLPGDCMLGFFTDAHAFVSGMLEWQRRVHDDESYWCDPADLPEHLRHLMKKLFIKPRTHTQTPMVIATGFSNLVHKVSASLQGAAYVRPDVQALCRFCDSFVSMTTDMGVEFGMGDFKCGAIGDLLPPWHRILGMVPDMACDTADHGEGPCVPAVSSVQSGMVADMAEDIDDEVGTPAKAAIPPVRPATAEPEPDDAEADAITRFVYRHALTIPGALHQTHILSASMHEAFPGWEDLWGQLNNVQGLLGHRYRRNRLIKTCVVPPLLSALTLQALVLQRC